MDVLTFISQIVKSLAWPVATAAIVIALREQIKALLRRLTSLKHNDTEVKFSEDIEKAKEALDAKAPVADLTPAQSPITDIETRVLRLIEVSPSAGLVEAWSLLESAARRKAKELGFKYEQRGPIPLQGILDVLVNARKIDEEDCKLIQQMREWRNTAAHSDERQNLDPSTAWKFSTMAIQLIKEIEA
jgi:hypothetical protein